MAYDGWGFALQSAVNGYMRGKRMVEDDDEAAYRAKQRERDLARQAEEDATEADLKNAARQADVQQGAGGMVKPATMDNRDVGLPENADLPNGGLMQGGYSVAGKAYDTQQAAQSAADAYNGADAQASRAAKVYAQHGKIDKSMALEASRRSAEAADMQLADARWKRDLGAAMRGGHGGLAKFATGSEIGPMAGLNVQAVPSADGKTVTYSTVAKDGTATAIPGLPAFSNDENGMVQAAWMLDRTITPQQRMEHFTQAQERERQQKNTDRNYALAVNADNRAAGADTRAANADARADRMAGIQTQEAELRLADAKANAKIPPAVKVQVEGIRKELDTINTAVVKAQADGSWDPASPGAKQLLERQAVLGLTMQRHLKPYVREAEGGQADPLGILVKGDAGAGRGKANPQLMDNALKSEGVSDDREASFIRSIYQQESGSGANTKTSNQGAVGPMQIVPGTFRGVADKGWDISNEEHSTRAGVRYAREAWKASGGDPKLAGAYYYGGPDGMKDAQRGVARRDKKNPGAPNTLQYGEAVAARMETAAAGERASDWAKNRRMQPVKSVAAQATAPEPERQLRPIDYSGIGGRMSIAAGQADPMEALYQKQVAEMSAGSRASLSPDVAEWKRRQDEAATAATTAATKKS